MPFKAAPDMSRCKFYKDDNNFYNTTFLNNFFSIVVPAELSPTKQEYVFFKGALWDLVGNLFTDNLDLEFKNNILMEDIFKEKLIYGELMKVDFINIVRKDECKYPIYDLTNLEKLKKAYPMIEKYIEKVPKTITPESFE